MTIDSTGAGAQCVQDTATKIIDATDAKDLPPLEERMFAIGWAIPLLRERAADGDEVADGILSAVLVLASDAPITAVLREVTYVEERRQTAQPVVNNPVAAVPPPPPMVPTSSAASTPPPVPRPPKGGQGGSRGQSRRAATS